MPIAIGYVILQTSETQNANLLFFSLDEKPVDLIKHSRVKISDFEVIKVIGRGAFGEVQLVSLCTSLLFRVTYDCSVHIKYCISMCLFHLHFCAAFYASVVMRTRDAAWRV